MAAPTQAQLRNSIVDVLGTSVLRAMGLKESLVEEKSALEAQDMDALDNAIASKSRCVSELATLDGKRADLCTLAGFSSGPEQMQSVIEWCDEGFVIANAWDNLMTIAADCNALNMTNGAIIRLREQQIRSSLSLLRGQTPAADTYGPPSQKTSGFEHRSLAEA
jgi:flagella synthesis protein FlgN